MGSVPPGRGFPLYLRPMRFDFFTASSDKPPSFHYELPDRRRFRRRRTKGNRVLMLGKMRELALYRATVLADHGFTVATPQNHDEAVAAIRAGHFDIAILSYTLSNETVQKLAELIREYCPECPLIVISKMRRKDREIAPDETVDGDEGPAALVAALRRVTRCN